MSEKARESFIEEVAEVASDPGIPDIYYEVWQDRPYTAVKLHWSTDVALGFAKAKWPDEWDPEYGEHIALRKAAAKIWKVVRGT